MKTRRRIAALTVTALLTVGMTLNFSGCSKESAMGPSIEQKSNQAASLAKSNNGKAKGKNKQTAPVQINYPQEAELTLVYDKEMRGFIGGNMHVLNGSKFHVNNCSFTPPNGMPKKKPVTITMKVDKIGEGSNAQLIFTFGPSGSEFNPPAQIRLNWQDLGINQPKLYYIKGQDKYEEMSPDHIDISNKTMILYVDHFSRYALAHSE